MMRVVVITVNVVLVEVGDITEEKGSGESGGERRRWKQVALTQPACPAITTGHPPDDFYSQGQVL